MEAPEPKSIHAMTDDERRQFLSRREPATGRAAMEIGGDTLGRRVFRAVTRLLALLAVATLFVVLFFKFTASWRVAMIVVTLMLAYMLAVGRMVEGRADRIE